MSLFRRVRVLLIAAAVGISGLEVAEKLSISCTRRHRNPGRRPDRPAADAGQRRRSGTAHGPALRGGRLLLLGRGDRGL